MPIRDMASDLSAVSLFVPGVLTATPAAVTADTQNFEAATLYVTLGIGGMTFTPSLRIDLLVQHSDDNISFVNVASSDIVGSPVVTAGVVQSYQAVKAAATIDEFGYKGAKRYVQATPVFVGVHTTGTAAAGIAIRGFPLKAPVA